MRFPDTAWLFVIEYKQQLFGLSCWWYIWASQDLHRWRKKIQASKSKWFQSIARSIFTTAGSVRTWACYMRNDMSGIILYMRPANGRRRYIVTSLIGWAHAQNYPCMFSLLYATKEWLSARLEVSALLKQYRYCSLVLSHQFNNMAWKLNYKSFIHWRCGWHGDGTWLIAICNINLFQNQQNK